MTAFAYALMAMSALGAILFGIAAIANAPDWIQYLLTSFGLIILTGVFAAVGRLYR